MVNTTQSGEQFAQFIRDAYRSLNRASVMDREALGRFGKMFKSLDSIRQNPGDAQSAAFLRELAQTQQLDESSGAAGGYTVPTELRSQILQLIAERSIVSPRAFRVPMMTRSLMVPCIDPAISAAGDFASSAGLTSTLTEQDTAKTETEPAFLQVELVANERSGYSLLGRGFLQDAGEELIGTFMRTVIVNDMSSRADWDYLRGDGAGRAQGVINSPAALTYTRASANTVGIADLAAMLRRLLTSSLNSSSLVWICHPRVFEVLLTLESTAGDLVFTPTITSDRPGGIYGIPLIVSEKLPDLGNTADLALCDLAYYLVGEREGLSIQISEHSAFTSNQVTYRWQERADGQSWLSAAVTLADNSTTQSPFVLLGQV